VLFVDLSGFTDLAAELDPEDVRAAQAQYFRTVSTAVATWGGVVEKYIGDAVMAVFGAPTTGEDDPHRAVRAALQLCDDVARQVSPTGSPLRVSAGVATGEAVVDLAAARDHGQALVSGDVVNLAARLQDLAPPAAVLVDAATRRATHDSVEHEHLPAAVLRGRRTPTEVYAVRGLRSRRGTVDSADDPPLVGRTAELEILTTALARTVQDRRPQLISLVGAAGIGKSRLVRELFRRVDAATEPLVTWRTGRCLPYGDGVSYAALAEIVKSHAGILESDDAGTAASKLDDALQGLVADGPGGAGVEPGEVPRLRAALAPLVGLPAAALDAEESEQAWRRVVLALAARRPTVLVVEDLHWSGEALRRFLDSLVAAAEDVPLLVLCTSRPEAGGSTPPDEGCSGSGRSLAMTLSPLRGTEVSALLAGLLDRVVFPAPVLRQLAALSGGVPLYAQEYVRMLTERGILRREGSRWTLPEGSGLPMPETVHAVVASRLDLLDPADRTVLAAAAVVGESFWPGAVAATLGAGPEPVRTALGSLVRRGLVLQASTSSMAGEPEFRFRHVLVRDVAYGRIARRDRAERHRRAADWLEGLAATRAPDTAEVLAHHRSAALELVEALGLDVSAYRVSARTALAGAARRAYRLHAVEAALGYAERALALWPEEGGAGDETRRPVALLHRELQFRADPDEFYRARGPERLRVLAEEISAGGDHALAGRAWTLLGQVEWLRADRACAVEHLGRALALYAHLPDSEGKATAHLEWARLHMVDFRPELALPAAATALRIARALGLREAEADALITDGSARWVAGEQDAVERLEAALAFCRAHGLPSLRRAANNLSTVLLEEGELVRSAAVAREGMAVPDGRRTSLVADSSEEAEQAYFDGDWPRMLRAADAFLDRPGADSAEWDLQLRGTRAWARVLRGEDPGDDVAHALHAARRGGFQRTVCSALAAGALESALRGRPAAADRLLAELEDSWRRTPGWVSREWLPAAAHAAGLVGPARAGSLLALLDRLPRRTRWVQAARCTLAAAVTAGDGDHAGAGRLHGSAALAYERIGDLTDAALAHAAAVAEHRRAGAGGGDAGPAARHRAALAAFVERNGTPRLLDGLAQVSLSSPASMA